MAVKCCQHSSAYIFDPIFFILSCNKDSHNTRMSSKFREILPWTAELPALEHLENNVHSSTYIFDQIFFILSCNKDSHEILDEFEIWRDSTMDCGVSCL